MDDHKEMVFSRRVKDTAVVLWLSIPTLQTLHGRYAYKLTRPAQAEAAKKPSIEKGGEHEVPPAEEL